MFCSCMLIFLAEYPTGASFVVTIPNRDYKKLPAKAKKGTAVSLDKVSFKQCHRDIKIRFGVGSIFLISNIQKGSWREDEQVGISY